MNKLKVKTKIRNFTIQFQRECKKPKSGSVTKINGMLSKFFKFLMDKPPPRHCCECVGPPIVNTVEECVIVLHDISYLIFSYQNYLNGKKVHTIVSLYSYKLGINPLVILLWDCTVEVNSKLFTNLFCKFRGFLRNRCQ